jgi:zinc/manganese transport system permease protein
MLDYDFMQNAFEAAAVVAIVSGLVGYFLVLRGQAFAAHAPPTWGLPVRPPRY